MLGLTALANAADPLNGTLTASIQQILTKGEENACTKCEGPYHNKSLKGLRIVSGLKSAGDTHYDSGTILDPQSGKTYKLKGNIVEGGKKLELRGFIGFSALGRNQTWIRAN